MNEQMSDISFYSCKTKKNLICKAAISRQFLACYCSTQQSLLLWEKLFCVLFGTLVIENDKSWEKNKGDEAHCSLLHFLLQQPQAASIFVVVLFYFFKGNLIFSSCLLQLAYYTDE